MENRKGKGRHKIDVVVALAQACLGAVQQEQSAGLSDEDRAFQQRANEYLARPKVMSRHAFTW